MDKPYKIALIGLMTALTVILGYVERLFPLSLAVPGIKLGLANIVVLFALYALSWKEALFISVVRVFLSGFLFSGVSGILYSAAGAILAFLFMLLAKKSGLFSAVGVSIAGGVFHNIGQLSVAALVVRTPGLFYYLPVLLLAGCAAGFVNGLIAASVIKRLPAGRK
jgi:heptaprenyl diphosphate synthase